MGRPTRAQTRLFEQRLAALHARLRSNPTGNPASLARSYGLPEQQVRRAMQEYENG